MHHLSRNIRHVLDSTNLSVKQKGALISFTFAQALAYQLQLPSAPIASVKSFYTDTHGTAIGKVVSDLNEHFVIDVRQTLDLVFKIFNMRYDLVYNATSFDIMQSMDMLIACGNDNIPNFYSDLQFDTLELDNRIALRTLLIEFKNEWAKYSQLRSESAELNSGVR